MSTSIDLISGGAGTIKTNAEYVGPFTSFYVVVAGTIAVYHQADLATNVLTTYYKGTSVNAAGDLIKGKQQFGKITPSASAEVIIIL